MPVFADTSELFWLEQGAHSQTAVLPLPSKSSNAVRRLPGSHTSMEIGSHQPFPQDMAREKGRARSAEGPVVS